MAKQNARELAILGLFTAILFLGQVFLAVLPNIELVAPAHHPLYPHMRQKGFSGHIRLCAAGRLLLRLWDMVVQLSLHLEHTGAAGTYFPKNSSVLFWSILSGFFGLAFGALCALPYFAAGGIGAAIAYWTSGLLFDVTHCVGNFIVCLVLFRPLRSLLAWLYTGQHAL